MALSDAAPMFAYAAKNTPIHRVPATAKLLFLLAFPIPVFAGNWATLAGLSIGLAVLVILSRPRWGGLLRNAALLAWYAAFMLAFRAVGHPLREALNRAWLVETGCYLWRLALLLLAGTTFYESTSAGDIHRSLATIQNAIVRLLPPALRRKIRLPELAFLLSLTLTFLPRIFALWRALERAWVARGGNHRRGVAGAWLKLTTIIPLFVIRLLAMAADTDRAIANRRP